MNRILQFLKTDRKLGLRIIKTGIAVTLCAVISYLLKLNFTFLAVVAAVASMEQSIDQTVKAGRNKMIGALIGALLGGAAATFLPANAGICGIGIIIVLYFCHFFRLQEAELLSILVFSAILYGSAGRMRPWENTVSSVEEALIGIAAAVLVNLTVFPPNYSDQIKRLWNQLLQNEQKALEASEKFMAIDVLSMEKTFQCLTRVIKLYVSEAKILRWNDDEVLAISAKASLFSPILDELKALEAMNLHALPEEGDLAAAYRYHMHRLRSMVQKCGTFQPPSEKPSQKKSC